MKLDFNIFSSPISFVGFLVKIKEDLDLAIRLGYLDLG